jgi:hypothetical protein
MRSVGEMNEAIRVANAQANELDATRIDEPILNREFAIPLTPSLNALAHAYVKRASGESTPWPAGRNRVKPPVHGCRTVASGLRHQLVS